jgi:4-carboxymuconolactone decarboxylase
MSETTVPTASIEDLRAEVLLDVSPTVASVVPDLNKLARNFALGEIWPRTGLSQRDRSIATIAALVALSCDYTRCAASPTVSPRRSSVKS